MEIPGVFLVDDEPPALKRLTRLLDATGRVRIVGATTDPVEALGALVETRVDVLFLDIEMPELNGFELLARLPIQPTVVFTTAYNQYALRAFEVNSIDYLLKPVEAEHLERALNKLDRLRISAPVQSPPDLKTLAEQLAAHFHVSRPDYPTRIPSRLGDRVQFIDLGDVTHFFAEDKLTFAATAGRNFVVDHTISELEAKLDPRRFIRIHRSTLVNLDFVGELDSWSAGATIVRLNDGKRTELPVARDRLRALKERLHL